MTKSEQRHLDKIASMYCVLCDALGQPNDGPVHVHHIREGHGMAQRASNFLTIPVCPSCHQGTTGIHGDKSLLRIANVNELDLLAMTIERLVTA